MYSPLTLVEMSGNRFFFFEVIEYFFNFYSKFLQVLVILSGPGKVFKTLAVVIADWKYMNRYKVLALVLCLCREDIQLLYLVVLKRNTTYGHTIAMNINIRRLVLRSHSALYPKHWDS